MDRLRDLSVPIPATPAEPDFMALLAAQARASVPASGTPAATARHGWTVALAAAAVAAISGAAVALDGLGDGGDERPLPATSVSTHDSTRQPTPGPADTRPAAPGEAPSGDVRTGISRTDGPVNDHPSSTTIQPSHHAAPDDKGDGRDEGTTDHQADDHGGDRGVGQGGTDKHGGNDDRGGTHDSSGDGADSSHGSSND